MGENEKRRLLMDSVKVLGLTFKIDHVPYISRDENVFGEISYERQEIKILDSLKPDNCFQTLLHEMLHAIFSGLGMSEQAENETLVQGLATGLHQCLTDNKELFQCFLS